MPTRCRLHGLGQRRQAALALEPRFLLISDYGVPTAYLRVLKDRRVGASNLVAEDEPRIALAIAVGFSKKRRWVTRLIIADARSWGVEHPDPSEGGHVPVDRHISNSGNVEEVSALALGFVVFAASD